MNITCNDFSLLDISPLLSEEERLNLSKLSNEDIEILEYLLNEDHYYVVSIETIKRTLGEYFRLACGDIERRKKELSEME